MPDVVQNVLIDFQVNYDQLTTAQEQLAKAGKIDSSGFNNLKAAINSTATDTKGLINQFKTVATSATKMGKSVEDAFGAGIQDALDQAGVSAEDFAKALTKTTTPAKTLKQELLNLTNAIAEAKVNGKAFGTEFDKMIDRAGQLKVALASANKEVRSAGTGTEGLEHLVGTLGAAASGFAAVEGAAALFGDESKDLQKTLIKVNGAMALAQGIQGISIALSKEGAVARLADIVATNGQIAVQKIYTLVTGEATAATTAFKAALALTGIGLFVVGIIALNEALKDTNTGLEDTNRLIESQNTLAELNNASIDRNIELRKAQAKAAGASESELIRLDGESLKRKIDNLNADNAALGKRRDASEDAIKKFRALGTESADAQESFNKLNDQIEKNNESLVDLNNQLQIAAVNFKAAIGNEAKEAIKKAEEAAKKLKELRDKQAKEAREARILELKTQLAELQSQLLAVEKNTQAEVDIKKKIVGKKSEIELQQEKLTASEIKLIKEISLNDQLELQKEFNKKVKKEQLEAQISTNKAILDLLNVSDEERLQLQIENINTQAQLEENAAVGNAAKIMEIEGKKYADIRALKLAALKQQQADDIQFNAFSRSIILDALHKVAADTKLSADNRIGAIKGIEIQELASNAIEVKNNQEAFDKKLISEKEYNKKVQELADARVKIAGDTQAAINAIISDRDKQRIDNAFKVADAIANIYSELSSRQTDLDNQRIAANRQQIADLLAAGAISQKEADARQKQQDAAEKRARQQAAIREKNAALFTAALAIPKAFLEGLEKGGLPLAALYAALAAVQAALIASKPIPRFFRGKQGNYEGPGEVADMGAELVERNGRMFLYTKPTTTYLGAKDKVYTASQTRAMLHNTDTRRLVVNNNNNGMQIDYARMGAAIPKSSISINIDKDFISESVAEGLSKTNYMGRRYRWQ